MKIVYCLPQMFHPGGIERIISIKASYLADVMGWEVTLVLADQHGQKPFYNVSDKIRIIDLGLDYDSTLKLPLHKRLLKKRILQRLHKSKLQDVLAKLKADIVISTLGNEAVILPTIKDGSKKLLEFHFCRGHKRKMADVFNFGLVAKLAYRFRCWQEENLIIPKYDQFVVLTEEDEAYWSPKVPSVKHISNILPFEREGQACLNNKRIIAVGRLDAQKGFDRLISIWSKMANNNPEWKVDIYGNGQDRMWLQSLVNKYNIQDSLTLHAPDQDIKQRYLESSIFVMTSTYEGLPMTLLEATGLGLPAVCYDFTCGPKDVISEGENGFIIREDDEDTFIQKLQLLIDNVDQRKQMGQNAYEMSLRYSRENIMTKWVNLFVDLCKK